MRFEMVLLFFVAGVILAVFVWQVFLHRKPQAQRRRRSKKKNLQQRKRDQMMEPAPRPVPTRSDVRRTSANEVRPTLRRVGLLVSESTSDDTILELHAYEIGRELFRYFAVDRTRDGLMVPLDVNTTWLADDDVLESVPGYESVGKFKVVMERSPIRY